MVNEKLRSNKKRQKLNKMREIQIKVETKIEAKKANFKQK